MKELEAKISEYVLSPFIDDEETIKIKEYASSLTKLDDFKDLELYVVQCKDTPTLNKKLKLADITEQIIIKGIAIKNAILSNIPSLAYVGGSYLPKSEKILVFLDNGIKFERFKVEISIPNKEFKITKKSQYSNDTYLYILQTMYHEKRHYLQHRTKDNSFSQIMFQIEEALRNTLFGNIEYKRNHNGFYMEIDANTYSIKKIKEYFERNPNDSHHDESFINFYKNWYEIHEQIYDFDSFFTAYNVEREIIYIYNEDEKEKSKFFPKEEIWHKVLYGDRKRIKSIEQILSDPNINELDPKFINYVLTSRYLNDRTDYTKLKPEIAERLYNEFLGRYQRLIQNVLENVNLDFLKQKELERLKKDLIYYYRKMVLLNRIVLKREENPKEFNINYLNDQISSKKQK